MPSRLGTKSRRLCFTLITLWLVMARCHAGTLQELLVANVFPLDAFSSRELAVEVQGSGNSNQQQILLAYRQINGELLAGPLHLLRYDKLTGGRRHADAEMADNDLCTGSVESIRFLGAFALLATHISPSAACLLVLGTDLRVRQVFHGFGPVAVEPEHVVLIEDLIHFAAVHPERLQRADVATGKTVELYPSQHDPLRVRFIREHSKHMPDGRTCALMNDPCTASMFDEEIRSLNTDGHGRFAFLSLQSASHATQPETAPDTVVSQAVLYVYQHASDGWRSCEVEVEKSQIEAMSGLLLSNFPEVGHRCVPISRVVADMSTASNNPFMRR